MDAIRVITKKKRNHNTLLNYIDDLIYIGLPSKIHESYTFSLSLLQDLGLEVSDSKLVPPCTRVTCLGIQVDTVHKILSIPNKKLQEIKCCVNHGTHKKACTKQQFQSLLGSLLYITKCVKLARIFLNCMLQVLRSHHDSKRFVLNADFLKICVGSITFLEQYTGITCFNNKAHDHTMYLDASMAGMGSIFGDMVYTLPIPSHYQHLHITQLEKLNVVMALKVWAYGQIK